MKKVLLGVLTLAVIGTACKKSKDKPALTKENLMGTYSQVAATVSINGSAPMDAFAQMEDCDKDDLIKLNANNEFILVDAGIVCDPSNDATGTWELNGTTLTLGDDQSVSSATITNFDGTYLETKTEYDEMGIHYVATSKHKKQ